jgi:hypothetical protein
MSDVLWKILGIRQRKEVKKMAEYRKPVLAAIGDAAELIQGSKRHPGESDTQNIAMDFEVGD